MNEMDKGLGMVHSQSEFLEVNYISVKCTIKCLILKEAK